VVAGAFTAIVVKLAIIQGPESAGYVADGRSYWDQSVTLPQQRGAILDRNGYELVMPETLTEIVADPFQVLNPPTEAQTLSPVLGISASTLDNELSENTGYVVLAHTVPNSEAAAVKKLIAAGTVTGITTEPETKMFYPAGQLALPLLGQVGADGSYYSALELKYNNLLSGKAGKEVVETDPEHQPIPGGTQQYVAPKAGDDLVLSLDEPLQYQAEVALDQAVVAADAHSGIVILMNSKTGEILADAELTMPQPGKAEPQALPVYVPAPPEAKSKDQIQPVEAPLASSLTSVYEPGSVNKLITISAALQEGIIKPSDVFTIPDSYPVSDAVFHDSESHPTEHWSVTDILANSSNIGTIQIAQRLGKNDLLKYIKSYGLGQLTDLDFPGESPGLLPTYWSGTSIATVAIGQGIAVTAMQMISAYNTIANGGVYVPPRLVDAVIDDQGKEHVLPMAPRHRVVSTRVAQEMTTMLEEVVRVGTGTAANLDPYTVAGKTGTALVPLRGGYEAGHYVASFAGFVPAEDPQITAMVVIDNTRYYGASASAPTFATAARDALQDFDISPLPKQAPAPGVPLATPESATGAEPASDLILPGLLEAPILLPTTTTTVPTPPKSNSPVIPRQPTPPTQPSDQNTQTTQTTLPEGTSLSRSRSSSPSG
jgi:cell division protein FtsI (penicillin-binding protein 3)